MKAFVSYSFKDSELYLITLLFEQLRNSGYVVDSSAIDSNPSYLRQLSINNSDVFLGIITNNSESVDHVIREWKIAKGNKIKNILLIEEGVKIEDTKNLSFIRFNRRTPRTAINQLFNINTPVVQNKQKKETSVLEGALIAGGIIVGLAALISLLSDGKKK